LHLLGQPNISVAGKPAGSKVWFSNCSVGIVPGSNGLNNLVRRDGAPFAVKSGHRLFVEGQDYDPVENLAPLSTGYFPTFQAEADQPKVTPRAANSGGPGGPTGPLCTPSRTPWALCRQGKCHRKRARASARTFGSTVRPTALLLTELSPQVTLPTTTRFKPGEHVTIEYYQA
jgi:hypothetical protein